MAQKKKKSEKSKAKLETGEQQVPTTPARLAVHYRERVFPALRQQFDYANPMQVPGLRKIVVNMGVGRAAENKARIDHAQRELAAITGQRPLITRARVSVAGFKLRQGMPIGVAVTLRRRHMWEFLDRLITVAIPRIRDFRGMPRKFDGRGNYTIGLSEQSVFPEISLDKVEFVQGMNITFVTTAGTDQEAAALLEQLGFPFQK